VQSDGVSSVVVLIVGSCTSAFACSCAIPGPIVEEALQNSDVVFIGQCIAGKLKKVKDPNTGERYLIDFTFKIEEQIKRLSKHEQVVVETGIGHGDCGYPFRLGVSYLVFGHHENESLVTHICTRNRATGLSPYFIEGWVEKELKELRTLLKNK